MSLRILFICKNRDVPLVSSEYTYSSGGKSSGLLNSVKFMVDMLTKNNIECKVVDVADNNAIDREVTAYKPSHVIIEALWVVPTKFEVLTRLHPKVKWIVRLHSEIPFIAGEGIAFDWIPKYSKYPNVFVGANSKYICKDIEDVYGHEVIHLPNYYPIENLEVPKEQGKTYLNKILKRFKKPQNTLLEQIGDEINVGCFGAIRPLKNQLIQAVAAMRFAKAIDKTLKFHINGNRVEGKGDPVLKNIRKLFEGQDRHQLVEHDWMPHDQFVELLKSMDITLQVSFTETYNIVAADAIAAGKPVIVSKEITFVDASMQADPTDTDDMITKMFYVYSADQDYLHSLNYNALSRDARTAQRQWLKLCNDEQAALN